MAAARPVSGVIHEPQSESFVNYWLRHDGMIVRIRIQVYLSSLLLALTSKFHFAKMLITPNILRSIQV